MSKHKHIKALLLGEIEQALERLSKRGVGYIDITDTYTITYCIDNAYYLIEIRDIEPEPYKEDNK